MHLASPQMELSAPKIEERQWGWAIRVTGLNQKTSEMLSANKEEKVRERGG